MKRIAIASLFTLFVVTGCQDAGNVTEPLLEGPAFDISDGAHNDGPNGLGNEDFWFLPPLVPNPAANPEFELTFEPEKFNPNLTPTVRICVRADVDSEGRCPSPGAIEAQANLEENHYHYDWKTNKNASGVYRVEVLQNEVRLGFFDAELSKKGKTADPGNIPVKAGSDVPVKSAIETNAVCIALDPGFDPDVSACATATLGAGGSLGLGNDANAKVNNGGTINMTFCTDLRDRASQALGRVDIPTFGPCVEIENLETFVVTGTATLCESFNLAVDEDGLSVTQASRMTVHRKGDNDLTGAVALPHGDAAVCNQQAFNLEPAGLDRLALLVRDSFKNTLLAARDKVFAFVGPQPLMACDRGGCGSPTDFESSYQAALPSLMEYHTDNPDGDLGEQLIGTVVTAKIQAWDSGELEDDETIDQEAVENVRLTVALAAGSPGSIVGPTTIFTDADGIATFQLEVGAGVNTVEVSGIGVGTSSVFAPSIDNVGAPPVTLAVDTLEFTAEGVLFFEDFEDDLTQWVGKLGGAHSGDIVVDPLDSGNNALTFTQLIQAGDLFGTEVTVAEGDTYVLKFDYLGVPGSGTPGNLGGTIGFAEDTPNRHRWLAGTTLGSGIEADPLIDDGLWRTYEIEFDVFDTGPLQVDTFTTAMPPSNNTIRVMLEDFVGAGGVAGDVFFDNIVVKFAPNP